MRWSGSLLHFPNQHILKAFVIPYESLRVPNIVDLSDRKQHFKNLPKQSECFALLHSKFEDTILSNFTTAQLILAQVHYVL